MKKSLLRSSVVRRWIVLLLAALARQAIPLLFSLMEGDKGAALYVLHLYITLPLCALVLPCWAALGGVHPLAAFFPIGGALLLLPVYESPGMGLGCLALSLLGASAGQEWKKRKSTRKGGPHGGTRHS